jgi:hypothetical protein
MAYFTPLCIISDRLIPPKGSDFREIHRVTRGGTLLIGTGWD